MRVRVAVLVAALGWSGRALADAGPASGEGASLELDLTRQNAIAMGDDCATACRAVDSMRRAAQRICEIEPGDACVRATETLRKALLRVRTACPECALSKDEAPPGTVAAAPPQVAPADATEELAVRQRRGCGSCSTTEAPEGSASALLPWALGLVWLARRRRAPK